MRSQLYALSLICLATAGCTSIDEGDGRLTHTSHELTAAQRAAVQTAMGNYLRIPVSVSGLRASYDLNSSIVVTCGYVGAAGGSTPKAIFAGTFASASSSVFVPLKTPGKGQDAQRIQLVRDFCRASQINI